MTLSPRKAFWLFFTMVVTALAQAVWWIVFMARLVDEKVDMAVQMGVPKQYIDHIQKQEISRQIMVGLEGLFFLVLILVGAWLIYRALRRTEQLTFHQTNFLMAVTHELKTPLQSIGLYLESLESAKIPAERKQAILPRMKEDIQRLEHLVENILEAGRFDRADYRPQMDKLDLAALLHERLDQISRHPSPIPVTITRDISQSARWTGDERAIGRAFDTILENSLKYHGGNPIHIAARLTTTERSIVMTLTDRGSGFDKREARAIFDRFYRVGSEMTRQTSGTGLGLYLCREIIRAHGGKIEAHSEGPGKGASFTITLPLSENHENHTTR